MQLIKFTTKAGFVYINPAMIQAVDRDNLGSYVRLSNYSQGVLEPIEKVLELLGHTEEEFRVVKAKLNPVVDKIMESRPKTKPVPATKKKAKKR